MLREGLTYSQFAAISRAAFVECAVRDFGASIALNSNDSIAALTGIEAGEVNGILLRETLPENAAVDVEVNTFARVLHGWHNDRDYVGPYGFPIDLPFHSNDELCLAALARRHAPGISAEVILTELKRIGAVKEVGTNIWQPVVREYIDPTMSPENIQRMGKLVESLLATLENNTRTSSERTIRFDRTMNVDAPLSDAQMRAFEDYLKTTCGQFLQRVDAYAAIDLQEKMIRKPGEEANLRAGLQCYSFQAPSQEEISFGDLIRGSVKKN
jgi:Family of unknown function (DUF6502)